MVYGAIEAETGSPWGRPKWWSETNIQNAMILFTNVINMETAETISDERPKDMVIIYKQYDSLDRINMERSLFWEGATNFNWRNWFTWR